MKRFMHETPSATKYLPVVLELSDSPVHFIGPATRDNPTSQVRTKLMGKVIFQDRKIKWNRVTLQFIGKAGIDIEVPRTLFHREGELTSGEYDPDGTTRLQTTTTLCEVEKELIFSGEPSIEFGLHLPSHLPASRKAKHAFVEYTLLANFSGGAFFKKYKTHQTVTINRHYLPNPGAMIPTLDYSGIQGWFEWSAEVPKATAVESGETVLALRCSVEKERVEVDRIEMAIEETESYRFSTRQGAHHLPPIVRRFPSTTYHLPSFSNSSETHFIRAPIPYNKLRKEGSISTHYYSPFLEVTHQCLLTVHFTKSAEPVQLQFPLIITDYPLAGLSYEHAPLSDAPSIILPGGAGDDAVNVDFDLPEYTPRYEENPMPAVKTN